MCTSLGECPLLPVFCSASELMHESLGVVGTSSARGVVHHPACHFLSTPNDALPPLHAVSVEFGIVSQAFQKVWPTPAPLLVSVYMHVLQVSICFSTSQDRGAKMLLLQLLCSCLAFQCRGDNREPHLPHELFGSFTSPASLELDNKHNNFSGLYPHVLQVVQQHTVSMIKDELLNSIAQASL